MYTVPLLVCLVTVAYAVPKTVEMFNIQPAKKLARLKFDPYRETWESFKRTHGKSYDSEKEEANRRAIFMENVKAIEQHNWEYFNNKKSYFLDINQFTDLTLSEYRQLNGLLKPNQTRFTQCSSQFRTPLNWQAPASVDWRDQGYVTPVKDQGQCGSCWSFSTTGSLEGQHFRKNGTLVSLSEQQLVDCSSSFGNQGCNGGLMDQAFEYINSVGGLESEADYPYTAQDGSCHFKKKKVVADLSGCVDVQSGSEQALMEAVASQGPISVAIDASHQSFQTYGGGVYIEPACSSSELDHGVLVVGYGSLDGQEYWIVKNSWGLTWGQDGYILMARNKNNMCGIATQASYPVV